ncbi:MAG TPA: lysophospholipid acyltransferase family protein [Albidovulum sp.]|uniref:lysophospholipid acyltransferase family protein n=1 Tax=Albidovulum sp. TaxID=1872424 RepID=UPI002BB98843|nr:lysophospholipid acyltransferase family protein [Albidovulum sp.]
MGTLGEILRGGRASARWFCGAPFVNLRIALTAKDAQHARRLIEAHFTRFLETCQISVDVGGTPPEPGAGCVVCYNEASFADVAAFGKVMWPHIDRAAAADLYAYLPFGRSSARKAAIELVPRGNRLATERLLEVMVRAAKAGERLAWGGEGRLSGQDGVARFKIGASLIAIRAQVPVIPMVFYGGYRVLPLGSIRARPGTIHARFGAPIPTAGLEDDDARDLADHTQAIVARMYEGLRQQSFAPA